MQACETLDTREGMTERSMWRTEPPLKNADVTGEAAEEAAAPVLSWALMDELKCTIGVSVCRFLRHWTDEKE